MAEIDVKHSCSEIKTVVKWKIDDFAMRAPQIFNRTLFSPLFNLYKSRLEFRLNFKSKSNDNQYEDHCSMFLFCSYLDNEKEVELKWYGWVENEDGKEIGDQMAQTSKFSNLCSNEFNFVKHSELYPPESDFIKNDTVYICCEIVQNKRQRWFKSIPLNDIEIMKHFYKTSESWRKNKKSGKLTIQMKNNRTLKVKKIFLANQSSVFKQMIETEDLNETTIEDFEPEVMEAFIGFTHLQYITLGNVQYAHDLLKMSDKYNVIHLKNECTKILAKTISKDNVFELLKTCFTYNCPKLKEKVLAYICCDDSESSFKDIMKTDQWKEFIVRNGPVSDEIIDAVFAKIQWFKTNGNQAGPSTSAL